MTVLSIVYVVALAAMLAYGALRGWNRYGATITAVLWPVVWLVMLPALRLLYQCYAMPSRRMQTS